jgi:lipopolysaccharide/colanic/teichoic acid biosynthesis glycosyltransferase
MNTLVTLKRKTTARKNVLTNQNDQKLLSQQNPLDDKVGIEKLIEEQVGKDALKFLSSHVDINSEKTFIEATTTRFNIQKIPTGRYSAIVNLKRVNDIRWINKFFETVNEKIANESIFIGFVETKKNRKARILNKYPTPFNWVFYTFDFFHKRIAPKVPLLKRIYFHLTKGENRVITKAETLGRLISCGFEIVEIKEIDKLTYFVSKKKNKPTYDLNPSYGPFFKMPRVGKNGEIIKVYKLRTMHPYSEYLQDYMVKTYGYDNEGKGKINNDFRTTTIGKFFRKYWLDELPQLINVLKGEMGLVGVRPLSRTRFNEFPEEMKARRIKYKPGCFPPYVALLMPNEEDNIKAEKIYLDQKEKHPIWTDIKFFWLSVYNIVTNKIRSA